jgi:uncharacterized membrane protein YbhN (UPF0104 family)
MHRSTWKRINGKVRGAARSSATVAARYVASRVTRRRVQCAILTAAIGFFAWALFSGAWEALHFSFDLQPGYLMLAAVLLVLRGPLPAFGWWAILRHMGHPLPWWRAVRIVYHSALAGYVPGFAWNAVSRVIMAEQEGIPRATAIVSVAIESLLVLLAALIVALLSATAWPDARPWIIALGLFLLMIALIRPRLYSTAIDMGLQRFGCMPINMRLTRAAGIRLLLPFILNWIVFGIIFWAIIAAIHPEFSALMIPAATGIFAAGWAGGYLAIVVPQGLGVRELIVATLMIAIGVPAHVAVAGALLARLCSVFGVGLWALISARL